MHPGLLLSWFEHHPIPKKVATVIQSGLVPRLQIPSQDRYQRKPTNQCFFFTSLSSAPTPNSLKLIKTYLRKGFKNTHTNAIRKWYYV